MKAIIKKYLLLSLIGSLACTSVFAQTTYGINAGPAFSGLTTRQGEQKTTTQIITSFSAGFFAEIPLSTGFYLEPQFQYEGKGGKYRLDQGNTRLSYLTLPVDLVYQTSVGNGFIFFGAGPYLGYGIRGKSKITDMNGTELGYSDPFKGRSGFHRLDAGVHLQAGYKIDASWRIGLQAAAGLSNLQKNNGDASSVHNASFGLFLGYQFGE